LSKIVTRTGDDGTTGLADGARLSKDHPRIVALGSVDELNSQLGVLLAEELPADIRAELPHIQHDLFDLGGALALPEQDKFDATKLARLDELTVRHNADLPPLKEFILPGGSRAGALCHVARSIARRAERNLTTLSRMETVPQHALPYLNRLSDLLFVLSRVINRAQAVQEISWQRQG
jgi:cob(I)alamin adenosyltransferase